MSAFNSISQIIKSRRSIYPQHYIQKEIDKSTIEAIIENATWAPNHKKTEPWRFIVFHSEAGRQRLSDYFAAYYKNNTAPENFSEIQQKKASEKPMQSACVIAIVLQHHPEGIVPDWEEIAAVSCAVQNMWLSTTAAGLGSYWSSPGSILKANEFLGLKEGERCLGLFFMGHHNAPEMDRKRISVDEKTSWL